MTVELDQSGHGACRLAGAGADPAASGGRDG